MKVFDNKTGKEVEKTPAQFKQAQKYYPGRFTEKKPKEVLPEKVTEEKKK